MVRVSNAKIQEFISLYYKKIMDKKKFLIGKKIIECKFSSDVNKEWIICDVLLDDGTNYKFKVTYILGMDDDGINYYINKYEIMISAIKPYTMVALTIDRRGSYHVELTVWYKKENDMIDYLELPIISCKDLESFDLRSV